MLRAIAWLASNEAIAFEADDHLVDGGWADAEVALHIGFGQGLPTLGDQPGR